MPGRRHTADVPAVAHGEQRQQSDRRVLHGVDPPGEVEAEAADLLLEPRRDGEPYRRRLQAFLGQVQRVFSEDVVAQQPFAHVAEDLGGNVDLAVRGGRSAPGTLPPRTEQTIHCDLGAETNRSATLHGPSLGLHGSPAGAIAVFDPRLGAVVVASHHPNWREGQVLDITVPPPTTS